MSVLWLAAMASLGQEPTEAPLVEPLPPAIQEGVGAPNGLRLSTIEDLAVAASPSLAAAEARVRAARWECVQAGLPPNPTAGYVAGEIGNEGQAGQQGAFVSQRFVRGGKLDYAQGVAAKEARRREQELAMERLRVLTDTRTAFYDVYLSQREIDLTQNLIDVSGKAAEAAQRLFDAGEGSRSNSLLAEIENQRAAAARRQADGRLHANWRRLAALTGLSPARPATVAAATEDLRRATDWDETVDRVVATSPVIAARVAAIEKARCQIAREQAQVAPDITAQLMLQYDDATSDTIAGVQIGMPIPLWNRNQGGVGRAVADLTAAKRRLESTEQSIRRRLAEVYGRYEVARTLADALEAEVLPRAQQNLDLATQGYEAGEISFVELLTVQRTYFEVNLEALAALRELNGTSQLISGCLLAESGPTD